MPLTLRQLEGRRDACIEKIQELKVLADGIGGAFLSLFPQLPRVLEYAWQAANEETKRRKFEVQIEKAIKIKQFHVAQRKKARKTSKRLQRLAAPPASEDDSSQEMEQTSLLLNYLLFYILPLTIEIVFILPGNPGKTRPTRLLRWKISTTGRPTRKAW